MESFPPTQVARMRRRALQIPDRKCDCCERSGRDCSAGSRTKRQSKPLRSHASAPERALSLFADDYAVANERSDAQRAGQAQRPLRLTPRFRWSESADAVLTIWAGGSPSEPSSHSSLPSVASSSSQPALEPKAMPALREDDPSFADLIETCPIRTCPKESPKMHGSAGLSPRSALLEHKTFLHLQSLRRCGIAVC